MNALPAPARRLPSLHVNLVLYWLVMGLAYQLLYHGIQSPLSVSFWFHVLGWPVYVILGLLRWLFFPFAIVAIIVFAGIIIYEMKR